MNVLFRQLGLDVDMVSRNKDGALGNFDFNRALVTHGLDNSNCGHETAKECDANKY